VVMQRPMHRYSVTCVTHDEAVLHCLNALAYFAECTGAGGEPGSPVALTGLAWPEGWEPEDGQVTFHFSDPRRRGLFLGEATRLLPGKWTRAAATDEAALP
jgi:hypothetical protein